MKTRGIPALLTGRLSIIKTLDIMELRREYEPGCSPVEEGFQPDEGSAVPDARVLQGSVSRSIALIVIQGEERIRDVGSKEILPYSPSPSTKHGTRLFACRSSVSGGNSRGWL